jgi:hypothetical protein
LAVTLKRETAVSLLGIFINCLHTCRPRLSGIAVHQFRLLCWLYARISRNFLSQYWLSAVIELTRKIGLTKLVCSGKIKIQNKFPQQC